MIKVLFFASLREKLGTPGLDLEAEQNLTTIAALRDHLAAQHPHWAETLNDSKLLAARNQEMCGFETAITEGDEVAFFPPVTGG